MLKNTNEENTCSICKLGQILTRNKYNSRNKTRIYNDNPSDMFIPIRNKGEHPETFCKEIVPEQNFNFIMAEAICENDCEESISSKRG